MTIDVQLLARVYALVTEVEGMKAANQSRLAIGESVMYSEDHFQGVARALNMIGGLG